jgi:hypothetical protein
MSRWLQSVNQILETLDDRAERVVPAEGGAVRDLTQRLLHGRGASSDDDDYYDDGDGDYYDEDDVEDVDDEAEENSQDYADDEEADEPEEIRVESTDDAKEGSESPLEALPNDNAEEDRSIESRTGEYEHAKDTSVKESPPSDATGPVAVLVRVPKASSAKAEPTKETPDMAEKAASPNNMANPSSEVSNATNDKLATGVHPPRSMPGTHSVHDSSPKHSVSPNAAARSTARSNPDAVTTLFQKNTPPPSKAVTASLSPPTSAGNAAVQQVNPTRNASRPLPSATPTPPAHMPTTLKRGHQQEKMAHITQQLHEARVRAEVAEREVAAQHAELEAAAARLAEDRELATEEQEDLLEDHAEEMQNVKQSYEERLAQQQKDYQRLLADANARVKQVQDQRRQEGGDLTSELQEGLDREREALQQVAELNDIVVDWQDKVETFQQKENDWQTQAASLQGTLHETTSRERKLEEQMDVLKESHQKQLVQRQEREGQLEQNIAQLSAALSRQKEELAGARARSSLTVPAGEDYKAKYQVADEELVTCRGQLDWSNQRSEALQSELSTLSAERLAEVEQVQRRQRHHDAKVGQLQREIARLETALAAATPSDDVSHQSKLAVAQQQVQSLSDQLMRQQHLSETSKSEVLTLKGRLQAALARAENAEQEAASTKAHHHDSHEVQAQSGNTSGWGTSASATRRRKRGGRTVRSALGVRASSPIMLQVVQTVDALDLWMLETGTILKQEPLVRLGLLFYTLLLHAWCFALILFHVVESEHSDLGSLTARRAVLSGTHVVAGIP